MIYQQHLPPASLQKHVQYFWTLQHDNGTNASAADYKTFGPLVDGCPGIILQLKDDSLLDRDKASLPQSFLYGQTITRTSLLLSGQYQVIGACLYPHALKSVYGLDAHELTDTCLDLRSMPGKFTGLIDELMSAPSMPDRLQILAGWIFTQAKKHDVSTDVSTQVALQKIVSSKGMVALQDLHAELKISERSLERKFIQQVGISPKLFSRVCRFQSTVRQLRNNQYSKLSDIAFDNGYTDQAHFVRTFKEFSGVSPREFRKQITGNEEKRPSVVIPSQA